MEARGKDEDSSIINAASRSAIAGIIHFERNGMNEAIMVRERSMSAFMRSPCHMLCALE
jgi:hypothetical protein